MRILLLALHRAAIGSVQVAEDQVAGGGPTNQRSSNDPKWFLSGCSVNRCERAAYAKQYRDIKLYDRHQMGYPPSLAPRLAPLPLFLLLYPRSISWLAIRNIRRRAATFCLFTPALLSPLTKGNAYQSRQSNPPFFSPRKAEGGGTFP